MSIRVCMKCQQPYTGTSATGLCISCNLDEQEAPKSEVLYPGIDQIPLEALEAIGAIFAEGEIKYGKDNWKKQPDNEQYDNERVRHAIGHLMNYANGDRTEDHVAKVAWWAVTTIWRRQQPTPGETDAGSRN